MYIKTNAKITFEEFYDLAVNVQSFTSVRGKIYKVISISKNKMTFERLSTNKIWTMDLIAIYNAYKNLHSFRTSDFTPYLQRTKSPARGLLITLGLLKLQ